MTKAELLNAIDNRLPDGLCYERLTMNSDGLRTMRLELSVVGVPALPVKTRGQEIAGLIVRISDGYLTFAHTKKSTIVFVFRDGEYNAESPEQILPLLREALADTIDYEREQAIAKTKEAAVKAVCECPAKGSVNEMVMITRTDAANAIRAMKQ